jgi:hypothetical protein
VLEGMLKATAQKRGRKRSAKAANAPHPRFPVAEAVAHSLKLASGTGGFDLPQAHEVLAAVQRASNAGELALQGVPAAIRLEIALAEGELPAPDAAEDQDPLFRLRISRWGLCEGELGTLVPTCDPHLRILKFDASGLAGQGRNLELPPAQRPRDRNIVTFTQADGTAREPLLVNHVSARVLELSDGTRTASEIAGKIEAENPQVGREMALRMIEEMFATGLLWLQEVRGELASTKRTEFTLCERIREDPCS